MNRKKLRIFLLVCPIILLLGFWINNSFQQHQLDTILLEPDGLVWGSEEKQRKVRISQREDGERLEIQIDILGSDKKAIYKKTEDIDRDMFGGGFVRAIQVDLDLEHEIVIWHPRAKYYLDYSEGKVLEVPFDRVSQKIKDLAEKWYTYNVKAVLSMAILFFFSLCYYILYAFLIGVIWLRKRNRSK